MDKIWNLKKQGDTNEVKHLSAALNVNMIIARLLVQRGISTFNEAKSFFRPRLSDLLDPFLMKDMDLAVARIEKAIERQEKVIVYGDYDVDGTTSVAMMYSFLKPRIEQIEYYIPDRYSEGYGISPQSINYAIDNGFTLIIALDCGIKAVEKIEDAKSRILLTADGGFRRRMGDTLSGSVVPSQGARIAIATITSSTTPPAMAVGWRRSVAPIRRSAVGGRTGERGAIAAELIGRA